MDRKADNNRRSHALDIAHVGDCHLGPLGLQPRAAAISPVHHGSDGIAGLQQFGNDDATGFPDRAGHDDPWFNHGRPRQNCLVSLS
jgi:hypothetical protein